MNCEAYELIFCNDYFLRLNAMQVLLTIDCCMVLEQIFTALPCLSSLSALLPTKDKTIAGEMTGAARSLLFMVFGG